MADIDSLSIQISTNATSAVSGLETLSVTLGKLRDATKGGLGLSSIANQVKKLSDSANSVNGTTISNLKGLAEGMKKLSEIGDLKISSSIANQITKINTALSGLNIGDGANKISDLVSALKPLETLGKSSLSTTVNALNKLPEALQKIDTQKLYGQISALTRIFKPLADEMQKIANGFNAFPSRIQKLIQENENLSNSNKKLQTSYINLWAKLKIAYTSVKTVAKGIMSLVDKSSKYIENMNLFTVAMGEYASEAREYAETVSEIMGIDSGEWARNQGVFMTLATGFGVAGDRAYTMSKNLTQLGYDISSFFNIPYEDAMQKLQSGLAGELEPLRRIGYDLSVARLQQEAYTLGINKKVSAMTQAEKAELRYYAIMTQVTTAQGDMARTLEQPANQMRILKAQVEMAARSLGNFFLPILKIVLPYLIALAKVVRMVADVIAGLFNVKLGDFDTSGISGLASGAEDSSNALGDAADNAKKLQKYTMGFDELNVIDPNQGSNSNSGNTGAIGGSLGFDLPEYDFLGDATSKVSEITEKMREWLGIGDEINTWADLFKTRLGGILITVGLIGVGILAWKAIKGIVGIAEVFSKLGGLLGKNTDTGDVGDVGKAGNTFSNAITTLKGLVKTFALGLVVIAEVIAGAALIVGGIWLLGWELEQVGKAWQPVIDNGATIAIAMGIGTALLVGIGLAMYGLGTVGTPLIVNLALGIATLALLGVSAGLFLAEIWVVGKLLDEIGKAWQPVLDNGKTIAKGIGIGTGLLIGIGVVTAALGAATVASAGALPVAIALGAALLAELTWAFKEFCDNLIDVADKLSDDLHPALKDLNDILPDLNDNMEDFIGFMKKFAEMTVEYTKSSAISGFSATVDSIIKFFTKDPIKSLANDVEKQYKQSSTLNEKLELANPELQTAISNLSTYKTRVDDLKAVVDTIDTSEVSVNGFTNLVTISEKIADFGGELKSYYNKIKDIKVVTMDNMVNCINDIIDFAVRIKNEVDTSAIDNFTDAIKRLTTAVKDLPTSKTLTITAIYKTEGSAPKQYATGGFPTSGQMFVAREAGPELVGTIGNKSAVVNNEQIVASVARGVADANSEQNSLLREQNTLLRSLLEKESGVYLDGKRLTNSVEKYQSQRGRQIVVGGAL